MSIKLGKINIGRNTKKYTRDMSFDLNTTSDFGFCQPNLMLMVNPDSNVSIQARSLVRLAPMPAPSFARMSLISKYSFVPFADVCEYYESMLNGTPQGTREIPMSHASETIGSIVADVPQELPNFTPYWFTILQSCFANNYIYLYEGVSSDKYNSTSTLTQYLLSEITGATKKRKAYQAIIGYLLYGYGFLAYVNRELGHYSESGDATFAPLFAPETFVTLPTDTEIQNNSLDSFNPEGCDLIFEFSSSIIQNIKDTVASKGQEDVTTLYTNGLSELGISDTNGLTLGVRYSSKGRRLSKIFRGLGYSFDLNDGDTRLNVLPLLAFYKAWFDNYAPNTNDTPWTTTYCYKLIKMFDGLNLTTDLDFEFATNNSLNYLLKFINTELPNTFYTNECDFVSAHTRRMNTAPFGLFDHHEWRYQDHPEPIFYGSTYLEDSSLFNRKLSSVGIPSDNYQINEVTGPISSGSTPRITTVNEDKPLTMLQLRLLNTLSKWINKDSVIGTKLADYMRVHFGADVATTLLQNAYNLGTSVTPVSINDIYSNSDTVSDNGGDYLGAYAGKGIGFGNTDIHFKSDKHGIIIGMMSIVPENNYYQGYDTSLVAVDPYTIPRPEFDALGFELTNKGAFVETDKFLAKGTNTTVLSPYGSFGFIPRFSGFKFKHNVVNGDFRRGSSKDSLSCYYLDKDIISNSVSYAHEGGNTYISTTLSKDVSVPAASPEWRYVNKYPWIGNLNRIFYNDSTEGAKTGYVDDFVDDNFIIQQAYDIKVTDFLKPLSMSYDTFDEDVDNSNMSVHKD